MLERQFVGDRYGFTLRKPEPARLHDHGGTPATRIAGVLQSVTRINRGDGSASASRLVPCFHAGSPSASAPKQKQEKSLPDQRLLVMSSTKNQSKPAVTGRKTTGSVPVIKARASNNSAAPRRGLTRRRTPKSFI